MRKERRKKSRCVHPDRKRAVVVGAAHLDIFADSLDTAAVIDKRGRITVSIGGTAYNMACNLMKFGMEVKLITLLKRGSLFSNIILQKMGDIGLDKSAVAFGDVDEAGFIAYRSKGSLEQAVTASPVGDCFIDARRYKDVVKEAALVIVDLNNSLDTVKSFICLSADLGKPVYIIGVSEVKALKLTEIKGSNAVAGVFMNRAEASHLLRHEGKDSFTALSEIIPTLWVVTKDKDGVSLYKDGNEIIFHPAPQVAGCASFSGAGDAFSAGFIYSKDMLHMEYKRCIINANKYVKEVVRCVHANLYEQNILHNASEIIYRDSLTGLFNRKFFESEKPYIENQALNCPTYIVVFDIDNFKRINDTYGHDAGDMMLKAFGQTVKESIRQKDIPIRFGGEEFVLILFNANNKTVHKIANRVRIRFKNKAVRGNGRNIQTTVSGGISCFKRDMANIDTVIKKADEALYKAKQHGKDKICIFAEKKEENLCKSIQRKSFTAN